MCPLFFYLCVGLYLYGINHMSLSRGSLPAHTIVHFVYSLEVHLFNQIVFIEAKHKYKQKTYSKNIKCKRYIHKA